MIREITTLAINGQRQDDLLADIAEIEVEEHVDAADVFRLRLSLAVRPDGTWRLVDDARLAVWNRVAIRAGYPGHQDTLIDGYVTHIHVSISGSGREESYLELTGMDASVVLDLEDRQIAWSNKKDSDIAQVIFAAYGLTWEVEDTQVLHGDRLATVLQAETDIRFLQRLAARNGFECYIKDGRGYFRTANLEQPPQKLITAGSSGNVSTLHFEIDGTPPSRLEIRRIDPFDKRDERDELTALTERPLGKRPLGALHRDTPVGRRLLRQQPSVAALQLEARTRAAYAAASAFATASGDIDGRSYGAVLRAKRLVTIRGAGPTHDGNYYVTRVRHVLAPDSYVQHFEARRNAIGLVGTERFDRPTGPLPAGPSADNARPAVGNRLLPPQQTRSALRGGS